VVGQSGPSWKISAEHVAGNSALGHIDLNDLENEQANDPALARKLWNRSEAMIGGV
jgi:hypothetical protein